MKNALFIISILFLAACGGNNKSVEELIEKEDIEALKTKRSEISTQIKTDKEDLDRIGLYLESLDSAENFPLVSIYKIENQEFNHFVELQGSVETDQNILVFPEVQGTLLDFKVKMGDKVSKGQVVAIIDDGGMKQQLSQAKQRADLSKTTYEKRKRLWDKNVGSEIDFLQAETQYNSDQEMVTQMEKQLAKSVIRAPFAGQIDETIADEGQLVVPGQTALFRIVNLDNMHIHADVPEKYIGAVQKGSKVLVDLPVLDTIVNTKVSEVSNYINPNNRTFRIKIDVPNSKGMIKPNLTARLRLSDYSSDDAILIPQSIISEDSEGKQYVYRANSKPNSTLAIAEKVFIKTGKKDGDNIEILEGLKAQDVVIKEGARTVKDQQEVEIIK